MAIHACMMTQNELFDLVPNIEMLLCHVDTVTIVDGGSIDGTIPHLRNWSKRCPQLRFFIHPWTDNFPAQRNNYLRRVGEIAQPGDWLLAHDPDEFLDQNALEAMPELTDMATAYGFDQVGFRCRAVTLEGTARVWENNDDYWKRLLFRWAPDLVYGHNGEGAVHERLDGLWAPMDCGRYPGVATYYYEHRRQNDITHIKGSRNYFAGGGGPNLGSKNPRWVELRQLCSTKLGIETWHQFQVYLLKGNIDQELKDWMIKYRHETGWDGASEQREVAKTYFRLYHPEEEPEFMRGEYIE